MAAGHFLKQLTCTLGAHSTAISCPIMRSSPSSLSVSSSLPFLFKHHHKVSYCWPSHNIPIKFKIHTAAASSTALPHKASTPYISVLIQCPKDNAVITLLFSFFLSFFPCYCCWNFWLYLFFVLTRMCLEKLFCALVQVLLAWIIMMSVKQ